MRKCKEDASIENWSHSKLVAFKTGRIQNWSHSKMVAFKNGRIQNWSHSKLVAPTENWLAPTNTGTLTLAPTVAPTESSHPLKACTH
jgi:hypothetical protein